MVGSLVRFSLEIELCTVNLNASTTLYDYLHVTMMDFLPQELHACNALKQMPFKTSAMFRSSSVHLL